MEVRFAGRMKVKFVGDVATVDLTMKVSTYQLVTKEFTAKIETLSSDTTTLVAVDVETEGTVFVSFNLITGNIIDTDFINSVKQYGGHRVVFGAFLLELVEVLVEKHSIVDKNKTVHFDETLPCSPQEHDQLFLCCLSL